MAAGRVHVSPGFEKAKQLILPTALAKLPGVPTRMTLGCCFRSLVVFVSKTASRWSSFIVDSCCRRTKDFVPFSELFPHPMVPPLGQRLVWERLSAKFATVTTAVADDCRRGVRLSRDLSNTATSLHRKQQNSCKL